MPSERALPLLLTSARPNPLAALRLTGNRENRWVFLGSQLVIKW